MNQSVYAQDLNDENNGGSANNGNTYNYDVWGGCVFCGKSMDNCLCGVDIIASRISSYTCWCGGCETYYNCEGYCSCSQYDPWRPDDGDDGGDGGGSSSGSSSGDPGGGYTAPPTTTPPTTAPTPDYDPYISTIIFCAKVSFGFLEKCQSVANNIGIDVNYLMAAMAFETGETFSTSIENPSSCAVGLIQFTSIVCGELGTTMVDLRGMSAIEQLSVVEDYFQLQERRKGDIQTLEDVYMAIFCPVGIGKQNNFGLYSSPSSAYKQNESLDSDDNGIITKAEACQMVWNKYNRGLNYTCN